MCVRVYVWGIKGKQYRSSGLCVHGLHHRARRLLHCVFDVDCRPHPVILPFNPLKGQCFETHEPDRRRYVNILHARWSSAFIGARPIKPLGAGNWLRTVTSDRVYNNSLRFLSWTRRWIEIIEKRRIYHLFCKQHCE